MLNLLTFSLCQVMDSDSEVMNLNCISLRLLFFIQSECYWWMKSFAWEWDSIALYIINIKSDLAVFKESGIRLSSWASFFLWATFQGGLLSWVLCREDIKQICGFESAFLVMTRTSKQMIVLSDTIELYSNELIGYFAIESLLKSFSYYLKIKIKVTEFYLEIFEQGWELNVKIYILSCHAGKVGDRSVTCVAVQCSRSAIFWTYWLCVFMYLSCFRCSVVQYW